MSFQLQPTLEGSLLTLRPLRPEDFEPLYAAASDPGIWALHPANDRWQRPVFEKYFQGALDSGGAFAIVERSTGELAGSSRYYDLDEGRREVAIGFTFLVRRLWGGRHNSELKALMVGHAFRFVDSVIFHVGAGNLRSRRAVEKLGGRLAETFRRPGDAHDTVLYRLSKAQP